MKMSAIVRPCLLPRQQKINEMNGAHLASPIRGELHYAHWPQLGSKIHCPIGNQIWGPLGKQDVFPNGSQICVQQFGQRQIRPKPRSSPKRPFGQWMGENSSVDWVSSLIDSPEWNTRMVQGYIGCRRKMLWRQEHPSPRKSMMHIAISPLFAQNS